MESANANKIGLLGAVIISLNAMIGAGIFTLPAKLALTAGPAGIISYLVVVALILCMALSIARTASLYPQEGAFYTYASKWGGHFMGLVAAGAFVLGSITAIGLVLQIAAKYLSNFTGLPPTILGITLLGAITVINLVGSKILQAGQTFLLGCTIFALISTTVICFLNADFNNLTPFMPNGVSSLIEIIPAISFAFFGFESAVSLFSIVKNPEKTVPQALVMSILVVGSIYFLFISSIILAINPAHFTSANMPLSEALLSAFKGNPIAGILAKGIGISILTALIGVIQSIAFSASSLSYSLFKKLDISKQIHLSKNFFIVLISLAGLVVFLSTNNIGLFFNLVAIFYVFAYICAIVTPIFTGELHTTKQKVITYLGLLAALVILVSAILSIIKS